MDKAIKTGVEHNHFTDLVKTYNGPLERYIFSLASDPVQTQDIIQECYLNAFEHWHQLKDPELFYPWIKKIAYRIFLQKRGAREEGHDLFREERFVSDRYSPERVLERSDDGKRIHSSLNRLRREDRKIVLLHFIFGYSHGEIAERFRISPCAARKRLERARGKLGNLLGDVLKPEGSRLPGNDSLYDINLGSSFDRASWFGELSLIEAMLLDGVDVDERDLTGRTLLHYAALRGNEEAVDLLLRYRADRRIPDREGMTPGEIAFREKHFALWEKLK